MQITVSTIQPHCLWSRWHLLLLLTKSICKSWVLLTPSEWVRTPCLGLWLSLGVSQCPDCPIHLPGHSWLVTTSCLCHNRRLLGKWQRRGLWDCVTLLLWGGRGDRGCHFVPPQCRRANTSCLVYGSFTGGMMFTGVVWRLLAKPHP